MRAPAFWARDGAVPRLLSPLGALYAAATARRVARPGWHAPVPVLCVGNATAGGAGKTTVALDLGKRLKSRGVAVAFLTRGYGGGARGVVRVDPFRHDAAAVGDEALLLAAVAPTYVAADRAAGARAAVADGAQALVMDDGLQNPTLRIDAAVLVIDGESGFGNGRPIPAAPLREPVAAAAARCRAAVLIGPDRANAIAALPPALPVLRADLDAAPEIAALRGQRAMAFAGLGRPGKFFSMLEAAGVVLAGKRPFPDHHGFSATEFSAVLAEAARLGAVPVTTPKDAARLSAADRARVQVIGVRLAWRDEVSLAALLAEVVP
jgi:tetraacyldisaccharide 4'-kinase